MGNKLYISITVKINDNMVLKEEIKKLFKINEGVRLDFKRSEFLRDDNKNIAKALAAFANYEGGILLVGVTDNYEIEGMKFNKRDEEKIMQIAKDSCQPPITPEFSLVSFDEGDIYHINILKAERPVKTNDRWYIRHGSTIRTMEYEELINYNKKSKPIFSYTEKEELDIKDILLKENKQNILIQGSKEIPYLESKSTKGRAAECTIYAKVSNQFPEKAYYLETHINHITENFEKLKLHNI
ncbi:Putative DNA-binding domain protein [uncultured archaeon]|nr:Putative DNA-binding domain protein [uncultured archaeon]